MGRATVRVLLIGGTAEARSLAQRLARAGVEFVYSLAGVTAARPLPFPVRRGGFGGVDGLHAWLLAGNIGLLVDVSHPYAAAISANAALAGARAGVPVWRWQRPAWQPGEGDDWRPVSDWAAAATALHSYRRPLLTLGATPLRDPRPVPQRARWLLRCAPGWQGPLPARTELIRDIGPFTPTAERALMLAHGIDVVLSRNSGAAAVAAKLQACAELGLPVLMLRRPVLPPVSRNVADLERLFAMILERA